MLLYYILKNPWYLLRKLFPFHEAGCLWKCAPIFIRRPEFTRQRTTPQTNGEEKCARLQRKTLQGRTPDAHPYMLADIQQVTDTDVARTISYILYPTNRQGCIDRNAERGQSFFPKGQERMKKKVVFFRYFYAPARQTNRITSALKYLK